MKNSTIYIYITAVTAFVCICGILFAVLPALSPSSPEAVASEFYSMHTSFSLEKARDMLNLCSASYYPESLEALMKEGGYTDFEYFERSQSTKTSNGIAAGIALKHEEEITRIIVVFRGTYKEEWYSNFNIGDDVEHKGFSDAAAFSLEQIEDYINRKGIAKQQTILEITGHSRGGAVANLAAKEFTDSAEMYDVYAYTFASPNTTTAENACDKKYGSIFNICNSEDFICYIPLNKWGYTKYGTTIELPKADSPEYTDNLSSLEEQFYALSEKSFVTYPHGNKAVESFIEDCENIAPSLWDYYNKEIKCDPYTITLSEYMDSAATLLSGKKSLTDAMLLLSSSNSASLSPITNFIISGIDLEDINEKTDLSDSALGCAHAYETYMAWLSILGEDYFTE